MLRSGRSIMLALVLAMALAAPAPPASAPAPAPAAVAPPPLAPLPSPAPGAPPPFPPPRGIAVTPDLRSDLGTAQKVDAPQGVLLCSTTAGIVTYRVAPAVRLYDREGRPVGGLDRLVVGNAVRVYYVVNQGAIAQELDLQ
jgi:hypothetical protein